MFGSIFAPVALVEASRIYAFGLDDTYPLFLAGALLLRALYHGGAGIITFYQAIRMFDRGIIQDEARYSAPQDQAEQITTSPPDDA